jgi:transposase InsO family protein
MVCRDVAEQTGVHIQPAALMHTMNLHHPLTAKAAWFLLYFTLSFFLLRRALPDKAVSPVHIVRKPENLPDTPARQPRNAPKPPWVTQEVLRLRALSGRGCLKVAEMFNRRHADNGMTVGKSFVAKTIKKHSCQLLLLERGIRNAKPRHVPRNLIWGIDLTQVRLDKTTAVPVLGMIDHGSRACLNLQHLADLSTIGVLEVLLAAMKRFGKPKVIRSDNGSIFTSHLFRWTLACLGVRHQRIEPFMPWQNGRIERFFGTFKAAIGQVVLPPASRLQGALDQFRFFYNHIRPHTAHNGKTPAEAWNKIQKTRTTPVWFETWGGVLTGDYYPPP